MFAGIVRHDCQPPVLPTAKLPTGVLVRLSRRTSTRPLTPAAAPLATRALNWVAALEPNSTPLYCTQSPFARAPRLLPPPESEVPSVIVPDWASYDSASMAPYASWSPPVGGGVVPLPPADSTWT